MQCIFLVNPNSLYLYKKLTSNLSLFPTFVKIEWDEFRNGTETAIKPIPVAISKI